MSDDVRIALLEDIAAEFVVEQIIREFQFRADWSEVAKTYPLLDLTVLRDWPGRTLPDALLLRIHLRCIANNANYTPIKRYQMAREFVTSTIAVANKRSEADVLEPLLRSVAREIDEGANP